MAFPTAFSKILSSFARNALVPRTLTRFNMHSESGKRLVNGVELYYEKVGQGLKVLFCLPGAMGSTRTDFGPQLDQLKENFTLVSFDPRGYGKSIPPKRDFPLDFYHRDADDAVGLMEQLGSLCMVQFFLFNFSPPPSPQPPGEVYTDISRMWGISLSIYL
jgi:valacyclovir hydrolase